MKKILICTTFREFNGSSNDQIQRLFLSSLKNQTYNNWELIVTTFNEKNVENTLNQLSIHNKVFYSHNKSCRFSLTEVFENCISSIEETDKNIIIWTTCDVIFDNNFFENIIKNYSKNFCGTSHPHFIFDNIKNLEINKSLKQSLYDGIDTIFFDADIFLNIKNKKLINNYRFVNWGIFEHFLVAIGNISADSMINLWGVSNINKISNDRSLNNENSGFLTESWNNNYPVFMNFLNNNGLNKKYLDLFYCHRQFKIIAKKEYFLKFWLIYINYIFKKFFENIKKIIPLNIKIYIKNKLKS